MEGTHRILSQRRLRMLRVLAEQAAQAKVAEKACEVAATTLAENLNDLPFTLLYLLEDTGRRAKLAGWSGLSPDTLASPAVIALDDPHAPWPLAQVIESGKSVEVSALPRRFGSLPGGVWTESPQMAVVLPMAGPGRAQPAGFVVAGVSPQLEFNDEYRAFMDLLASHIATAVANARAYDEDRFDTEEALRASEMRLKGQKEAFQAAIGGAPLEASLNILARTVTEGASDGVRVAFYITNDEGTCLHPVPVVGGMPESYLRMIDGFKIGTDSLACGLAVASGLPVITKDVFEEPPWGPWLPMAREFDFRGCWSFPIETHTGKPVGTFAMYHRQPREATPRDLSLANAIAQAAAIIISRQTVAEERARAEAALRASEARQAFLLALSDALRPLADPAAVQAAACRVLGEYLGVNRVHYVEALSDGDRLEAGPGYAWGVADLFGRLKISDFGDTFVVRYLAGQTLLASDVVVDPSFNDAQRAAYAAIDIRALIGVPLVKDGRLVAIIGVHQATPRDWTPAEVALVEEVAERTWAAVERVKAEEASRKSEERHRLLFASIDEGFCTIEVLFDERGKAVDYLFLEMNPAFVRQTGLENAVGKTVRGFAPEHEEFWFETYGRIARTGEAMRFQHEAAALGFFYDVYAFRIDAPGDNHVAVLFHDITERKRCEANLQFLAELSDDFARLSSVEEILRTVGPKLKSHFGHPSRLSASYHDEERGEIEVIYDNHEPGQPDAPRKLSRPQFITEDFYRHFKEGRVIAIDDMATDPRTKDKHQEHVPFGVRSEMFAPFTEDGRVVFILALQVSEPHKWRTDEAELLQEIAGRLYLRLERARAEVALREAHAELERRVTERTAELARRAQLVRQLATAQEDERRRIARDLHDSVGQLLASLSLAVKAVSVGPLPSSAIARLADVHHVADALGKEVHGLAARLRPTVLDDLGLEPALSQLTTEWSGRTGVPVDFQTAGLTAGLEGGRLPAEVETVLYRVVQEALTNVARHAKAGQVSVVVSRHHGHATAVVEDDGIGFDLESAGVGRLGLLGMRERVAMVGGELEIESTAGAGTTVIARLPVAGTDGNGNRG